MSSFSEVPRTYAFPHPLNGCPGPLEDSTYRPDRAHWAVRSAWVEEGNSVATGRARKLQLEVPRFATLRERSRIRRASGLVGEQPIVGVLCHHAFVPHIAAMTRETA